MLENTCVRFGTIDIPWFESKGFQGSLEAALHQLGIETSAFNNTNSLVVLHTYVTLVLQGLAKSFSCSVSSKCNLCYKLWAHMACEPDHHPNTSQATRSHATEPAEGSQRALPAPLKMSWRSTDRRPVDRLGTLGRSVETLVSYALLTDGQNPLFVRRFSYSQTPHAVSTPGAWQKCPGAVGLHSARSGR